MDCFFQGDQDREAGADTGGAGADTARADVPVTPVHAVTSAEKDAGLAALAPASRRYLDATGFTAKEGEVALAPDETGALAAVVVGLGAEGGGASVFGAAAQKIPAGRYRLAHLGGADPLEAAINWARGAYQFTRYKAPAREPAQLAVPEGVDAAELRRLTRAIYRVRDLVNTPAGDMGPEAVEAAARAIAEAAGAAFEVISGDGLLEQNYPLIHAVGRAADEAPRLIQMRWGDPSHPPIAIIGKAVTFDSGGLNIKTGNSMLLMKKDMGGGAHALALAELIMDAQLPCHLHVLVPTVENSISDEAFRPGDILSSRAGKTVEIENTDAEGRLILADALSRALEDKPTLMVDFATLTGAARVALGADVAPFYTRDDTLAEALEAEAAAAHDPVWRMPLHDGYRAQLSSPVADLRNIGEPLGGSITAALFLEAFVGETPWVHFDVYAWNPSPRAQGPKGGEAQGLRAAYGMLKKRLHSQ